MTDEPTQTEPVTPAPETKDATFSTVVTASLLTCLLTGAGIVVMHESLKTKTLDLQYSMSDTLEKLNRRISALESQTRELAARPVPDNAPVEELRSGVAEAKNTITAQVMQKVGPARVADLARALAGRGLTVRPFKPQNMALNSAVTVDGGEIVRHHAVKGLGLHR